jgi:peptide/nickel transport system substrate-binding protein
VAWRLDIADPPGTLIHGLATSWEADLGLIAQRVGSFDPKQQDRLMARSHETVVADAVQVWVVHDDNAHALSPKVKSDVQAQHWLQDLNTLGA